VLDVGPKHTLEVGQFHEVLLPLVLILPIEPLHPFDLPVHRLLHLHRHVVVTQLLLRRSFINPEKFLQLLHFINVRRFQPQHLLPDGSDTRRRTPLPGQTLRSVLLQLLPSNRFLHALHQLCLLCVVLVQVEVLVGVMDQKLHPVLPEPLKLSPVNFDSLPLQLQLLPQQHLSLRQGNGRPHQRLPPFKQLRVVQVRMILLE
jgi:hypothetical protein